MSIRVQVCMWVKQLMAKEVIVKYANLISFLHIPIYF
jgi:hypothetical protein